MKKIVVFLFLVMGCYLIISNSSNNLSNNDTIRFRIIANSNTIKDQAIKYQIKEELIENIKDIENNSDNIESARKAINNNIPDIKRKLSKYNLDYNINFGNNYFPDKELEGINYPAGNYESLVITLGEGKGNNWWCMIFPPLCLIDSENNDNAEFQYKSYFKEILSQKE